MAFVPSSSNFNSNTGIPPLHSLRNGAGTPLPFTGINVGRERGDSGNTIYGRTIVLPLRTDADFKTNIRNFKDFHRLWKVYTKLQTLPEVMFEDWIACCMTSIENDAIGNTKEDHQNNLRIASYIQEFNLRYRDIMRYGENENDTEIEKKNGQRRELLNDALLFLLRNLLGEPCRLADEILTLTGFPPEK
jgi:hypothetical protein